MHTGGFDFAVLNDEAPLAGMFLGDGGDSIEPAEQSPHTTVNTETKEQKQKEQKERHVPPLASARKLLRSLVNCVNSVDPYTKVHMRCSLAWVDDRHCVGTVAGY